MKFHLKKIISGAQTGVDIGTAEAAMSEKDRSDLAVGIPQSRRTECNVAGHSETEAPGIQQLTFYFVIGLWQQLVKLQTE